MRRRNKILAATALAVLLVACNSEIEIGGSASSPVKKDVTFTLQGADIELSVKDISNDPKPLSGYTVQVQYCPELVSSSAGNYTCDGGAAMTNLSSNSNSSTTEWRGTITNASQAGVLITLTTSSGTTIRQTAAFSGQRFVDAYLDLPQDASMDGVKYFYDQGDIWKSQDGEMWFKASGAVLPTSSPYVSMAARNGKLVLGSNSRVWHSLNKGYTWTEVASSANSTFHSGGYPSFAYTADGSLYAFMNEEDDSLWKSTDDGVTWNNQVSIYTNVGWPTLNGPSPGVTDDDYLGYDGGVPLLADGNDLYMFGGYDDADNHNEVWKISSGATSASNLNSRDMSTNGIWMARLTHSVARFKGRWILVGGEAETDLWNFPPGFGVRPPDIIPGSSATPTNSTTYYDDSDVWASTDGASWSRVASDIVNRPFGYGGNLFVMNDTLFSIRGESNTLGSTNHIWKSSDAVTWTEVTIPTNKTYSQLLFQ